MKYSEIIKCILDDNNLSQQKAADLLNVNQTTVSQWLLNNKKPGFTSIIAIYEIFGVTPNELLGIDEIAPDRDFTVDIMP